MEHRLVTQTKVSIEIPGQAQTFTWKKILKGGSRTVKGSVAEPGDKRLPTPSG